MQLCQRIAVLKGSALNLRDALGNVQLRERFAAAADSDRDRMHACGKCDRTHRTARKRIRQHLLDALCDHNGI